MTWDELKKLVDDKLNETNLNGKINIDYIDIASTNYLPAIIIITNEKELIIKPDY